MQIPGMAPSFVREKCLLKMTLFLSTLVSQAISHCIPTPPCTTCDYVHALREIQDCRRYFFCANGRRGPTLSCRWNEVFSTELQACITSDSTNQCSSAFPDSSTNVQPHLFARDYSSASVLGDSYLYSGLTPGSSYGYGGLSKTLFPGGKYQYFQPTSNGFFSSSRSRSSRFGSQSLYPGRQRVSAVSQKPAGIHHIQIAENCGVKSSNWIVGGQESSPGRWAWQVSLQELNVTTGKWVHVCGGALVHESWVVTAGHCIHALRSVFSVSVVLGSYNLSVAEPGELRIEADKLIGHPRYSHGGNYPNDVGLIHLSRPAAMSRSISTVCLPQQEDSVHAKSDTLHGPQSRCWVTGWGRTLGRTDPHVLNEAEVDLIDREKCSNSWKGYITHTHICASGSGGSGACEGDSGGPLHCIHHGRYYLEGVVSWGENSCRLAGYPSVFTRVALYTDWIRNMVTSGGGYP